MFVRCLAWIFSLFYVPAIVSSEAVDASLCGLANDHVACDSNQIESSEEQEGAALKLEMLQRSTHQLVAPARTTVTAAKIGEAAAEEDATEGDGEAGSKVDEITVPAEGDAKAVAEPATAISLASSNLTSEDGRGENVLGSVKDSIKEEENVTHLITKDHNGNMCMLCNKPLAERVDREYKEFRTDCGGLSSSIGPNTSILATPVAKLHQVDEDGTTRNGFCQLNFAKSCVDAVANKDYLYFAKSINMISGSLQNAAWDGRYCRLNGFLEASMVALQHDFHGTQAKAAELCKTKYTKYNLEHITSKDMMSAARYDDKTAPTLHEAELLAAWNCAMGDLGCDMALCAYSFCEYRTGTGMYNECEGWHPIDGMPVPKSI